MSSGSTRKQTDRQGSWIPGGQDARKEEEKVDVGVSEWGRRRREEKRRKL